MKCCTHEGTGRIEPNQPTNTHRHCLIRTFFRFPMDVCFGITDIPIRLQAQTRQRLLKNINMFCLVDREAANKMSTKLTLNLFFATFFFNISVRHLFAEIKKSIYFIRSHA